MISAYFFISLLVMNHNFIIMIQKSKSNQQCECQKTVFVQGKFNEIESNSDNPRLKSGFIQSISLESGASINARWDVNNCLSHVYDAISETREKTELLGLILHHNARLHQAWITNKFLAANRVESYQSLRTHQI